MIKKLKAKGFEGVGHLASSALMRRHDGNIKLSTSKPNVLVGPNGSGKSALMTTLSLLTLSHFTGKSELNDAYVRARESEGWWSKVHQWGNEYEWLKGLDADWSFKPAVYYRPEHIPGNETSVTHAMLCGYSEEARAYAKLTDDKSCGQKSSALLANTMAILRGEAAATFEVKRGGWAYGLETRDPVAKSGWVGDDTYKAEALKKHYVDKAGVGSIVLMDEPERSLDGRAEMELWKAIEGVDSSQVQVIVATHSAYPALHPERFHVIESEPGYLRSVAEMLKS